MRNFIFSTEGAHDVSFIGKLLARRGFKKVNDFAHLPAEWKPLFPTKFPWNGSAIERVARFPEIFAKDDIAIGLLNSGGDSRLIPELRNALDMLGPGNVERAIIFSDADNDPASARFTSLVNALSDLNTQAVLEKAPGYPIPVPAKIASLEGKSPEIAIFVFPDNSQAGTLEDILLECSKSTHPDLSCGAQKFVSDLDAGLGKDHESLKKMRRGLNKNKSVMGAIANVLKPGSSLAVAIEQQKLVPAIKEAPKVIASFDEFIGSCLE